VPQIGPEVPLHGKATKVRAGGDSTQIGEKYAVGPTHNWSSRHELNIAITDYDADLTIRNDGSAIYDNATAIDDDDSSPNDDVAPTDGYATSPHDDVATPTDDDDPVTNDDDSATLSYDDASFNGPQSYGIA
jgi:hypothetical protein